MGKLYANLRGKMAVEDISVAQMARLVGVNRQYIYTILSGSTQPRIDLCYDILEQLGETADKLTFYFPKNGIRIADPALKRTGANVIRIGRVS